MAGEHAHRTTSWIVVGLICLAVVILGFAFVLQSVARAVVGGVLGLIGVVTGGVTRIMDDAY